MSVQLYNHLSETVEPFESIEPGKIRLYTCGPTVYNYLTVGNWAAYIYWDTLVRTLSANEYDVTRVMNITDVGHLVSDADDGEDKLEKGARREGKTAWDVAKFYTDDFVAGMKALNLLPPTHLPKATEYIEQQLELVRTLKAKDFTYQIDDGIYFDTQKFPKYDEFAHLQLDAQKAGARVEFNPEKHHSSDFALWKFTPAGETRDMEWGTPLDLLEIESSEISSDLPNNGSSITSAARDSTGVEAPSETRSEAVIEDSVSKQIRKGFPGWHLECSAMAMSLLGETLDIHTGGIDHIPVHHTNEIAQSEAATGKQFSRFWLHNNHLKVNGTKISKSLGNGYTLSDLAEKGFSPLDLKLVILQGHYRNEGNFTFEGLESAHNRRLHWRNVAALRHQIHDTLVDTDSATDNSVGYAASQALVETLSHDLDTPAALSLIDETFSEIEKLGTERINRHALVSFLETIDSLLGLELLATTPDISDEVKKLIIQRRHARDNKNYALSDTLRADIEANEIAVRDTPNGSIWEYAA